MKVEISDVKPKPETEEERKERIQSFKFIDVDVYSSLEDIKHSLLSKSFTRQKIKTRGKTIMEIEVKKYKTETDEERKKKLYQVGNVLSNKDCTTLIIIIHDGDGFYYLVDLRSGEKCLIGAESVEGLADRYYEPTDRLVTKLTAEVEE